MKNFSLMFLLLLCVSGIVKAQQKTVVILKVKGLPEDSIYSGIACRGKISLEEKGILDSQGNYKYSFDLNEPDEFIIWAEPEKTRASLYIYPGDSLLVAYDIHNQDATIQFKGKGAEINRIFYEFNHTQKTAWDKLNFSDSTTTNGFLSYLEDWKRRREDILNKNGKSLPSDLLEHLKISTYIGYVGGVMGIPFTMKAYLNRKISESIPSNYWSVGKSVKPDARLLKEKEYVTFLAYTYPKYLFLKQQDKNNALDETIPREKLYERMYGIAKTAYENKAIKSVVLAEILKYLFDASEAASVHKGLLDDYLANYALNASLKSSLIAYYESRAAVAKGQVPPAFTMKDQRGRDISLADFHGKVVYMDFWASWCSPCRYEMKNGAPGLHEKFKDNKDVVFLYISIDDSEDAWKKAIEEDKIQGVHLLSQGGWKSKVARLFNIQGVPRYMLIGVDGKLYDNDATRPSQPQTAETITKLLNMGAGAATPVR